MVADHARRPGRRRCARPCSSTASGWRARSGPPTGGSSSPAGAPTPSSPAPGTAPRRGGVGPAARGHREPGAARFLTQAGGAAVDGRRRVHRRRPRRLGGPPVALAAARRTAGAGDRRRGTVGGSAQSARRAAQTDQEHQSARARRPVRHGAVRRQRRAGITDITPYWRPTSLGGGWWSSTRCPGEADDGLIDAGMRPAGMAPDVVARLDVPAGGARAVSAQFHGGGVSQAWPRTAALVRLV